MPNTNRIHIDALLVRRLIATQFPQWCDLQIKPIEFGGWDNRTFHLGERMLVRLPSAAEYSSQVQKEHYWLPKLAPFLPIPIPVPLAMGKPAEGYPWDWSVYSWLDGETASIERIANLSEFATALAEFLRALHRCDATGGPMAGPHNFYRGGLLTIYDIETRQAIETLGDKIDAEAIVGIWDTALASSWNGPPVWVHGDIAVGNLLVENGKLNAVIDFGSMGIGDPACDLAIAWTLFTGESRNTFRDALPLDSATWARARGWVLWKALITCAARPGTNPIEVEKSMSVIDEVVSDHKRSI